MKRFMTLLLLFLVLTCQLLAVGLASSVSLSFAPTFSHAENLEMDTLYFHTSGDMRIETAPLSLKMKRLSFGPYAAIAKRSDSLVHDGIVFLGYDMVSMGISTELDFKSCFKLGLSVGAGEGRYSFNETLFALIEGEIIAEFQIARPFWARTGVRYTRRDGFSDYSILLGLSLVKEGRR